MLGCKPKMEELWEEMISLMEWIYFVLLMLIYFLDLPFIDTTAEGRLHQPRSTSFHTKINLIPY